MASGYVAKLLDNIVQLVKEGDATEQIDAAKDIMQNNRDANPQEWEALDSKVSKLPQKGTAAAGDAPKAGDVQARSTSKTDNGRFVSGSEPGTGDNPIGYPGTDQDQDGPGAKKRTVPGQKLTKDQK